MSDKTVKVTNLRLLWNRVIAASTCLVPELLNISLYLILQAEKSTLRVQSNSQKVILLHYKDQYVNSSWGNNLCLSRESYETINTKFEVTVC
jgi:hypothetical protein